MKAIMFDTETLGTNPGSPILSIGAVCFDPWAPAKQRISAPFLVGIQLETCLFAGMNIDAGTLAWWKKNDQEAGRQALKQGPHLPLEEAMERFAEYVKAAGSNAEIYCKGGSFDFPILKHAYGLLDKEPPWAFWNERDHRTVLKVCQNQLSYQPPVRSSVMHSALADAEYQAQVAIECLRLIGKKKGKAI